MEPSSFKYGQDHLTVGTALGITSGRVTGELSVSARERIQASRAHVDNLAENDQPVYGINTGFGPLCTTRISSDELKELQYRIMISHSVGVGQTIPSEISKLMMILKVHSLSLGFSGISLAVVERIIWMIEHDIIPLVPSKGSVGASGDLAPLAHLFLPLIGHGHVKFNGEIRPAKEMLRESGLDPIELRPKEGLALINGTQFITAHAVMVVHELYHCLDHADYIGAMMIEGLRGSTAPFAKEIHEVRPYPGCQHVSNRIRNLFKDSEIVASHANCSRVQDPYSLRCIPQVHGASRSAWLHLKELVEIELNAVTDNPIITENGAAISGGNFHGQPLAMVLDYAATAASELGNISDRRI